MKFYDGLSQQYKELTSDISDRSVSMYVCGPTVYDRPHVGNARPAVVFDVLYRLLQNQYSHVTYVSNITDIDDKIIDAAKQRGVTIQQVTEHALQQYLQDMTALQVLPPTHRPRATAYIPQMQEMIQSLLDQDYAYVTEQYDVVFNADRYTDYGVFNHTSSNQHFALWKNVDDCQTGLNVGYCWPSPWSPGKFGRPGWHIECSAMSLQLLGRTFDIHGGGIDLAFPHHENEIAQTRCYTGCDHMARLWMHNGLIEFENAKMSKSTGNLLYLQDVAERTSSLAVRLLMLQTHYRHPLLWTEHSLQAAHRKLTHILKRCKDVCIDALEPISQAVIDALSDDLNTPLALYHIDALLADGQYIQAAAALKLLGLLPDDIVAWLQRKQLTSKQNELLAERIIARRNKNYALADDLRERLQNEQIAIDDTPTGQFWYVL